MTLPAELSRWWIFSQNSKSFKSRTKTARQLTSLKNGKITQEVAQMIADANILDRETIQKQKIKEAWKEKIENGNISTKDTQHLVNVIYGTEKELKSPQQEDPEHKEFREELQQYVYTPEQAAKNTAVREQKEIQSHDVHPGQTQQTKHQETETDFLCSELCITVGR